MQEDAKPARHLAVADQAGDANKTSLEAYLSSGKDPNHFLARARTQALRTKQFGFNPEPARWLNTISKGKNDRPPNGALHVKSAALPHGSRPAPLVEVPETEASDADEPEEEDTPLRRATSELGRGTQSNSWKVTIIGTGRDFMQAVKQAPLVRSLMSDGEEEFGIDNKVASSQEEAVARNDQHFQRVVPPEQDDKAKEDSPVLLAPGMVNDEESPEASGDLEARDISKQTTSDGDQSSRATSAGETPSRVECSTSDKAEKADEAEKPEKRIREMVRGITTMSQTRDLKNLIENQKAAGKESLLSKLARKKRWTLQHAHRIESALAPILAKFGHIRKSVINDETTFVPSRLDSKSRNSLSRSSLQVRETWQKVVDSTWFSMAACVVVMLHSLFLAIDTDFDLGTGANSPSFVVDSLFTVAYIAELCVRMLAYRQYYLTNSWNILDLVLVCLSVADLVVVLASSSADPSLSVMASLRMVRLLRLARLVRVFRFFKPLWLLVCGIAASMRTVFWAWLLINLLIYIFGLVFTRVFSPYTCAVDEEGQSPDPELNEYFGNVGRSMFSVFQCITLEDWIVLADVGARHEPWTRSLFMLILGTCTWGVMHVITAVFVESALEASQVRSLDLAKKAKDEYNETCQKLCEIFWRADADNDGALTKPEFLHSLSEPAIVEKLRNLGIDRSFAVTLFDILDLDGSGTLDSAEFVEGVLRSRGPAQNKDVIGMRCDVWRVQLSVQDELERACNFIEAKLQTTMDRVQKLQKEAAPVLQCVAQQDMRRLSCKSSVTSSAEAKPAIESIVGINATEATKMLPTSPSKESWTEDSLAKRDSEGDLPSTRVLDFEKPPISAVVSPRKEGRNSTSERRPPSRD